MGKIFNNSKYSDLDVAISALRDETRGVDEALSPTTRGLILDGALNADLRLQPQAALFVPTRRWILAGVLPVMTIAALVAVAPFLHLRETEPAPGVLAVSKHGSEVVFTLANGKRQHTITRSTVPNRFDPAAAVRMKDGSFVDNAAAGAGLVFYRID